MQYWTYPGITHFAFHNSMCLWAFYVQKGKKVIIIIYALILFVAENYRIWF